MRCVLGDKQIKEYNTCKNSPNSHADLQMALSCGYLKLCFQRTDIAPLVWCVK
jgi:hypothetical protein